MEIDEGVETTMMHFVECPFDSNPNVSEGKVFAHCHTIATLIEAQLLVRPAINESEGIFDSK